MTNSFIPVQFRILKIQL